MGSVSTERIDRDFLVYKHEKNDRRAEQKLNGLLRPAGDAERLMCRVIARRLGAVPPPLKTDLKFSAFRTSSTFRTDSEMMADEARTDTLIQVGNEFRKDRKAERLYRDGKPAKPIVHAAAYIARTAIHCCGKPLRFHYTAEAQLRAWFNHVFDPELKSPFQISPSGERIGLRRWSRQEALHQQWRVLVLMAAPEQAQRHVPFARVIVTNRQELAERVEEILDWCGTSLSKKDLWRIIKPLYNITSVSADDDAHAPAVERLTNGISAEDQALAAIDAEQLIGLLKKLTPEQQQAVSLFYFGDGSGRDVSCSDIGEALQKTEMAVNQLLHRARMRLIKLAQRQALEQALQDDFSNPPRTQTGNHPAALQEANYV